MINLDKDSAERIFNSIEHLNHEYNLNVKIPKDIPEGCNVISWKSSDKNEIVFYKEEEEEELHYWSLSIKDWCSVGNISLEQEVSDDAQNGYYYVYLRLATKDNSDVFTPERLLGVETKTGFITSVEERFYMGYKARVTTTKGFSYFMETLDYYISDDSDETVSFEDYVRIFYEE